MHSMDYKHRFPDYRYRPERKKSRAGLWALLALVVAFIAVAAGWAVTRHKEEPIVSAQQETQPAKVDANPVTLPAKPAETKPGVKKPVKPTKEGQKPGEETNPGAATHQEPRFTFYKILPEKEAIIPESVSFLLDGRRHSPLVQQHVQMSSSRYHLRGRIP